MSVLTIGPCRRCNATHVLPDGQHCARHAERLCCVPDGCRYPHRCSREFCAESEALPFPPADDDPGRSLADYGPKLRPLEDAAALWAAPWWFLTWCLTFGRYGKPLWEAEP